MKIKTSTSMAIAKVAISLSLFNIVIALTSNHSVVLSKVRLDTADAARNVLKEAVKDIKVLKDIKVK